MPPPERERLLQGATALGLALDARQIERLLAYLALLQKWSRVYNLTAVRDPAEMLGLHLLDSLAVVEPLRRHLGHLPPAERLRCRLLDVGSGAGLPGVVLAIALPELDVTCVDTVGKKASFIRQAGVELGLRHLRAEHARVEALGGAGYDLVVSRAFASLADFTRLTRERLLPGGVWLAMKGKRPEDEQAALPSNVAVFHVEPVEVPGLAAERCLVWMRPQAPQ